MSTRITQYLRIFLAEQGSLSLPGFGVITLDRTLSEDFSNDSENIVFPAGSLSFRADPKTLWDEDLISKISEETGKMRTLVVSDLDSYLQFALELTNISKPFHIEGIGWIQKNYPNEIAFIQESNAPAASNSRRRKTLEGESQSKPIPWRQILTGLATAGLLAFLVWGIVRLDIPSRISKWKSAKAVVDTAPAKPIRDTLSKALDSARREATYTFRIVLEISGRNRAFKRYADLREWGHNVRMTTKDSVRFKLFIPMAAPLQDTARHRDSLRMFFSRRVWIETIKNE